MNNSQSEKIECVEYKVITATIVVLVLLTTILWFSGNWGKLILGEDHYFPLNPSATFAENSFAWKNEIASGVYNEQIFSIPYLLLLTILNSVMPLWIVQWLLFALFNIVTFLSFSFFIKTIFGFAKFGFTTSEASKRSSAVLAAFFYTFNPFTLIVWYLGWTNIIFSLFSFPLAFACFLKGFKKVIDETVPLKQCLKWILLSALIPSLTFAVHPMMFVYLLLLTSFSVYFLVVMRKRSKTMLLKTAKYVSFSFLLLILLNVWWALPYSVVLLGNSNIFGRATTGFFDVSTKPSTFLELFRLLGEGNIYELGRVPASEFYLNPIISLVMYAIVTLSIGALLLYKRRDRFFSLIIYFAFIFLFGLFITNGINPPLGAVNTFAFEYIPFFKVFRAPWGKLMLLSIFSLSTLMAFSLEFISEKTNKAFLGIRKIRNLIRPKIICMILLILISYPIISGNIYASHGIPTINYWDPTNPTQVTRPYHVTIPKYYYDAAAFINVQPEQFGIMILPYSPFYAGLNWGYTGGWDFLDSILDKPITNVGLGYVGFEGGLLDIYSDIINRMKTNPSPEDAKILYNFFNVKYVMVLKDWNFNYIETYFLYIKLDEIATILPSAGFTLDRSFGEIAIYSNNYWNGSKAIYAADTVLCVNNSIPIYKSLSLEFLGESSLSNHIVISSKSVNLPALLFQNGLENYFDSSWLPAVVPPDIWSYMTGYPNATVSYNIYITEASNYKLYAYLRMDGQRGTLKYRIDNGTWSDGVMPRYGNEGSIDPYVYGPLLIGESYLMQGLHTITLMNTKPYFGAGYQNLRYFFLQSFDNAINQESVNVSYVKINPARYEVHIYASKPFALIFSEFYHKGWVAYVDGQQISDEYHFMANGFANGWYINKTGTFTITLEFWPQNLFYAGSAISIATFFLCIIYVSKGKIKIMFQKTGRNKTSRKD